MAAAAPPGPNGTDVRAKRKRQEASSAEAEECFEVWRQTRLEKSKTQEQANMARWFNAPSLLPNPKDTKPQRSHVRYLELLDHLCCTYPGNSWSSSLLVCPPTRFHICNYNMHGLH
jgi:hypothetical protein